jgi:hypothetical protein
LQVLQPTKKYPPSPRVLYEIKTEEASLRKQLVIKFFFELRATLNVDNERAAAALKTIEAKVAFAYF